MPHHKSAEKRLKTNERDRKRNMAVKSAVRKQTKEFRSASAAEREEKLPAMYGTLDRAVRKGVVPKARVNRLKSRLAKASKTTQS